MIAHLATLRTRAQGCPAPASALPRAAPRRIAPPRPLAQRGVDNGRALVPAPRPREPNGSPAYLRGARAQPLRATVAFLPGRPLPLSALGGHRPRGASWESESAPPAEALARRGKWQAPRTTAPMGTSGRMGRAGGKGQGQLVPPLGLLGVVVHGLSGDIWRACPRPTPHGRDCGPHNAPRC